MKDLCVLIPSYNEAKTIGRIVRELHARHLVVYVVDDGSADDTALIAEAEGAVVVKHKKNKGKGASIREGIKHILKRKYEAVVIMDADGQHKSEDIDAFIKKMEETNAHLIVGNRMLDTASMPRVRVATNRFMSYVVSKMCRHIIPDTQCGFRLIRREVLEKIKLESSNYEIESEMLLRAANEGFRIESVPVQTVYEDESSKINPVLDALRFIRLMAKTLLRI